MDLATLHISQSAKADQYGSHQTQIQCTTNLNQQAMHDDLPTYRTYDELHPHSRPIYVSCEPSPGRQLTLEFKAPQLPWGLDL